MTEQKSLANDANIQSNDKLKLVKKRNLSSIHNATTHHYRRSRWSAVIVISSLSIVSGLYLYTTWQHHRQQTEIEFLQQKLTRLQNELSEKNIHDNNVTETIQTQFMVLQKQLEDEQRAVITINNALMNNNENLQRISERLSAMSPAESNNWLISEANYLVNLAGRKIWQDNDYVTARLLLKHADNNLAATHDPSLLPIRKTLAQDLATLSRINHVDWDGIVLQLLSLANNVSTLLLTQNYNQIDLSIEQHDDSFIEDSQQIVPLSSSNTLPSFLSKIKNWLQNFSKNLRLFMHHFVEIEKYNEFSDCIAKAGTNKIAINQCHIYRGLITPEQSIYLRENIRLQLYIASQAVIHRKNTLYQQALTDISNWIYAYFDTHDAATQSFLDDIKRMQRQPINNKHIPHSLKSAPALNKLMHTRIRSLLTAH